MNATTYSQDILEGRQVITHLEVGDLASGIHQLWFAALATGVGQCRHVPVVVIRGEQPGPRVMITAGVHGDELNGVLTAQQLIQQLSQQQKKGELRGTVLILPMLNISGIEHHGRDFILSDPDSSTVNLNRCFPGDPEGDAARRYLHALWMGVLGHNADIALDLHTQTRGADYPLFIFADYRDDKAREMAHLMNPDCILNDPSDIGMLDSALTQNGIPCITIEIGTGKVIQQAMIDRALEGITNILINEGVVPGTVCPAEHPCIEGNSFHSTRAELGGFAVPQVKLLQQVEAGQLVSIQYDAFGGELKRYHAPCAGTVLSLNLDPMREPGSLLVRLIY